MGQQTTSESGCGMPWPRAWAPVRKRRQHVHTFLAWAHTSTCVRALCTWPTQSLRAWTLWVLRLAWGGMSEQATTGSKYLCLWTCCALASRWRSTNKSQMEAARREAELKMPDLITHGLRPGVQGTNKKSSPPHNWRAIRQHGQQAPPTGWPVAAAFHLMLHCVRHPPDAALHEVLVAGQQAQRVWHAAGRQWILPSRTTTAAVSLCALILRCVRLARIRGMGSGCWLLLARMRGLVAVKSARS
eukprot:1159156-Pelagomonas_calceolata.AAC.19